MAYQILVFDPAGAPRDPEEFDRWSDVRQETEAAPRIARCVAELREQFPGYEHAPEELPKGAKYADYSVGGPVASISASFSVAAELEALVHRYAAENGIGFWDVSVTNGTIWYPPAVIPDTSRREGLTLTLDQQTPYVEPSDALIAAAVDWLDAEHGPGFLILEAANRAYVQAAGGEDGVTVECRLPRSFASGARFWHGVAASSRDVEGELIALPGHGRVHGILPNERLTKADAREICLHFAAHRRRSRRYAWHDITAALGSAG